MFYQNPIRFVIGFVGLGISYKTASAILFKKFVQNKSKYLNLFVIKNKIKSKLNVDILMEYQIHLDHQYVVQNLLLLIQ